jgi:hypothetical protein
LRGGYDADVAVYCLELGRSERVLRLGTTEIYPSTSLVER